MVRSAAPEHQPELAGDLEDRSSPTARIHYTDLGFLSQKNSKPRTRIVTKINRFSNARSAIVRPIGQMPPIPAPAAPGQIPVGVCGKTVGDRIIAACTPRIAPQDAREAQPAAAPEPKLAKSVRSIFRAAWRIAAAAPHEHGQRMAVDPDQPKPETRGKRNRTIMPLGTGRRMTVLTHGTSGSLNCWQLGAILHPVYRTHAKKGRKKGSAPRGALPAQWVLARC